METISLIYLFSFALVILFIIFLFLVRRSIKLGGKLEITRTQLLVAEEEVEKYREKYAKVIDIETECEQIKKQLESDKKEIEDKERKTLHEIELKRDEAITNRQLAEQQIRDLKSDYITKKATYDSLTRQIAIFSEDIELIELGFYEPKFDFDASEVFKEEIIKCKEIQKSLLKNNNSSSGAIYCSREWTVDGSRSEGKKMTHKSVRLTARAFNNECEAAIANCTWKNVTKMEERIKKAFIAINKLNESNAIYITELYLMEKLKELQLTYEYREKKQREKEEQAEIKAQMREEAKVEAEIKKAEEEAIKEEKRYHKALEAARKELEKASDELKAELEKQIVHLQANLEEAEKKHQRAQSMAEQTKQGHVYIISNIGSFGDDVYKIGMTRRLEPMDRVRELGDASVPFTFDVHAMIHTDDAPMLEKKLHDRFDGQRLNMINRRKEFFGVSLEEIKCAVNDFTGQSVEFIETAVAQDYYETQAMNKQRLAREGKLNQELPRSNSLPQFADVL
ncbi:DUF4041 domain-containing protein [Vibrio vulnificus]|uniref:DUF4041 domain-containing protein n=1 Tax=Vibrio vulnificus TaxID=672 RepID=UPI000929F791|nr:DUF4041 domain-containing protein [Vibrio vulnificus]OJI51979.1 hypothetical protein VV1062A_03886 [Vibrio vulnificus]OJI56710.1 hypothetical protein VFL11327_03101 [Vibrio fluvialis]